jgi:fermentation-respiration switch protein FrsA (DUF1100 family)
MVHAVLAAGLSLVAAGAHAAGRDPAGHWQGSLHGVVRLGLRIERTPDGTLRGVLDSPDQGAMGMALDSLVFTGDSLRFALRAAGGGYVARMSAGGDSLVGTWRQAGMAAPITFVRGAPPAPKRPQEPHAPYPYDTLEVAYDNPRAAGVRLTGTLTLPRAKGPFPAALLLTGSGQQDRDETVAGHKPFKVLADHLTRQGIAVLRVDDRGVGGSTGPVLTATSDDFASDALAGVEFLARRRDISRRAIGLVGHSEGGVIAPLVATRTKDVAFLVLLAAPGLPGDSLMLLQAAATRRSFGVTPAYVERELVAARRVWAAVRAGDSVACAGALRGLIEAQLAPLPESQRNAGGTLEELWAAGMSQIWSPWMRYFATHDPAPALRRFRGPVLALNGGRDTQVTPKENLGGIEAALRAGGHRDFTVRELPGLNHLFQTCTACSVAEYPLLDETFAPAALALIADWIRKRTGLAP